MSGDDTRWLVAGALSLMAGALLFAGYLFVVRIAQLGLRAALAHSVLYVGMGLLIGGVLPVVRGTSNIFGVLRGLAVGALAGAIVGMYANSDENPPDSRKRDGKRLT